MHPRAQGNIHEFVQALLAQVQSQGVHGVLLVLLTRDGQVSCRGAALPEARDKLTQVAQAVERTAGSPGEGRKIVLPGDPAIYKLRKWPGGS